MPTVRVLVQDHPAYEYSTTLHTRTSTSRAPTGNTVLVLSKLMLRVHCTCQAHRADILSIELLEHLAIQQLLESLRTTCKCTVRIHSQRLVLRTRKISLEEDCTVYTVTRRARSSTSTVLYCIVNVI